MYTEVLKNEIISSLKKDGFRIIDRKDFMIATKKESTLYIRSLEDIHKELNFKYLAQNMQLKKVGGVETKELKKLIMESESKETKAILSYVSNKLNWSLKLSDRITIDSKEIEFIELLTDKNEIITLVFFDFYKRDNFIALEMNHSSFLKIIDGLRFQTLQSLAPELYRLVTNAS